MEFFLEGTIVSRTAAATFASTDSVLCSQELHLRQPWVSAGLLGFCVKEFNPAKRYMPVHYWALLTKTPTPRRLHFEP